MGERFKYYFAWKVTLKNTDLDEYSYYCDDCILSSCAIDLIGDYRTDSVYEYNAFYLHLIRIELIW